MAGENDIQGTDDPRAKSGKEGAPKKKVPDPGKTTNTDASSVSPGVPGKRSNTDGLPGDAGGGVGKQTQVDASEGKDGGEGKQAKGDKEGLGGGGGGGKEGKETNHGAMGPVDEKPGKGGKDGKGQDEKKDKADKTAVKDGATGKGEGKGKGDDQKDAGGKDKGGDSLYGGKTVLPPDRVDIPPMPVIPQLRLDAPKANKNLDDKWRQETGRTPAEHHSQIMGELQKLDAEVQRITGELQSTLDGHVTKITNDIRTQVDGFKTTLIAPGRTRVSTAYGKVKTGFQTAETQALGQIQKHKLAGLGQITEAKRRNKTTLENKYKDAKALTESKYTEHAPLAAQAIKQFATGIPGYVKEAQTLANDKAAEAAKSFKPEAFMNATDLNGALKALEEEVKKQHALNHGKKLGAQYEGTLMGWSRDADKKAKDVIGKVLQSSQTELESALDVTDKSSQKLLDDTEITMTEDLGRVEESAKGAVTMARENGVKRFETEEKTALEAADKAGTEFTENATNAGTELTDRLKAKAANDAKAYAAVIADLQKQLKGGVPQKYEQVQPKIENAKASLERLHGENIGAIDKLVLDGGKDLTDAIGRLEQTYEKAVSEREGAAAKLTKDVVADINTAATDMGTSISNIGKSFDTTMSKEVGKVDFAIGEFQKGAEAALKDFGNKVKQQLEQERTALYEVLKANTSPDAIKAESEQDAAAEVAAKRKSLDKDVTGLNAAMDGWGTDEAKITGILRPLGHGEITYIHAAYNDHYPQRGGDGMTPLMKDVHDELSGNQLKMVVGYLTHDRENALKLDLADSIGFWNDDEERIESILRSCDQKELEFLTTNPEAKRTLEDVKDSLGGADLEVMTTLLDKDVDKAERENKANAIRLYEAMDGAGTDEAKMKQILEGAKTPEERQRLRAAFNEYAQSKGVQNADGGEQGEANDALTNMIKGDTSGGEESLMLTLAKTDPSKTELAAAKMYDAADGGGTNEEQLFEALDDEKYAALWKAETDPVKRKAMEEARKAQLDKDLQAVSGGEYDTVDDLLASEMTAAKLTWEEIESRTKKDGTPVSDMEVFHAQHYLEWVVAQRKLQTGQAEPELLIAYACFGDGTDEELLQKALSKGGEPMSIAETVELNQKFERVWNQKLVNHHELLELKWANDEKTETGPAPGGLLSRELSGKDWNKTRQLMCGKPETAEQLKYMSALRKEYATSGFLGGVLMEAGELVGYTEAKSNAEAQQERFDEHYAKHFKDNPTARLADTKEGQELERLGEYLAADYEAYSAALSALVDGIVTAIEIIGAVVITVLTAGTSAPVLMAVLYNLALSATTIVFKAAALGDQYGAAELGADVVKAAGSAAFAGIGEMKAIANITKSMGNAGAKGVNTVAKLGDQAITRAGVKLGADGLLEMTPASVNKLAGIIQAGSKSVLMSSGQTAYDTLTDEKTYSMKLEEVLWGENSLGKKLLTGAPKAFVSGAVTQWINGISGVSNRDSIGRLKKPFPNALGNALAEMGGATAGFFAYLDNYQDAEKFWKQLLMANVQAGISGFAQGWAMHKTRAKKSGRDFINGELTAEGLMELHKSLDPNEVSELAQFVEKYGSAELVAKLPDEFKAHTKQAGQSQSKGGNTEAKDSGGETAANDNSAGDGTTHTAKGDEEKNNPTGKKQGEDDPEAKAKQDAEHEQRKKEEAERLEAKRKQEEAEAEKRKQQQQEEEARKLREAEEAKRRQDEAEAAAKRQQEEEARKAEEQRLRQEAEQEAARKKAEQEAALKKQQEEAALLKKQQEEEAAAKKRQAEEDEAYKQRAAEQAALKKQQEEEAYLQKERDEAKLKKQQEDEMWAAKREEDERKQAELERKQADDVNEDDQWLSAEEKVPVEKEPERDKKRKKHEASDKFEAERDPFPEEGTDMSDPERKDKKLQRIEEKDEALAAKHEGELEVAQEAKERRRLAELVELATQAHAEYAPKIEDAKALLKELVGDLGEVQGRAKDPESAANRLKRAEDNFGAKITDAQSAKDNLWDALGTRVVVSGNPDEINQVIKKLSDAAAAGKLKIIQSNSNHGDGIAPYMTQADIDRLAAASGGAMEGGAGEVKKAPADKSAFTSGLIFVQYPDGTRGEIQIIGKKVLDVAAIEHIPYDVSIGKPLARGLDDKHMAEMKAVTGPVEAAIKALEKDPAKKAEYDQYLRDLYKHARNEELGIESTPPKLPAGIDKSLSAEGLRAIYDEIESIKAKAKAEKDGQPQQKPKDGDDTKDQTALADDASAKKTVGDDAKDDADPKTWADDQHQTQKPDPETPEQAKARRSQGLKPSLPDSDATQWAQPDDRKNVPEHVPLSRQELREAITRRYGKFVEKYQGFVNGDGLENHPDFKPLLDEMRALKPGSITREQGDEYLKRWTEISDRIAKERGQHGAELRVLYNVVEQDDFPSWFQHVQHLPKEQQAKLGHMWREEWKIYVRDMMSDESSKEILYLRDLALSGDRRGGNFQDFYKKRLADKGGDSDKALQSIAESSMRSNPKVNAWLTGAGDGISDLASAIRSGRDNDDGEQKTTTTKKPGDNGDNSASEQKDKQQVALTVDEAKLARLDELAKQLKSDDEPTRLKAQAEVDRLKADPEWKDALKLKDDIFGTAKQNQKPEGEDIKMLSDNIPTLLDEADKQRIGKNPELQAKRDKFERAVALAILQDGPIRQEIDAELSRLCEKAFDYLSKTRDGDDLAKSVGDMGLDAKKGYGGGVGKDPNVMLDVLVSGNIRERMIALASFMEILGKDALSDKGRANLQKMASDNSQAADGDPKRQYTAEDAKRLVERVLAYNENTDAKSQSVKGLFNPNAEEAQAGGKHEAYATAKAQDMDTKLPPLVADKVAEFLGKQVAAGQDGLVPGAEASPLARTTITVQEAIDRGLQLSDREIEAAGGLDAPLNWVVGQRANIVDPKAKFIADAKENSMPLKAGISGTTYRWMMLVDLLGGDPRLARLAAIASLQAADAHSFHEIATSAKGFGVQYDPNKPYAHLGLDEATLKALAESLGTTLDELNGLTLDDKTGK